MLSLGLWLAPNLLHSDAQDFNPKMVHTLSNIIDRFGSLKLVARNEEED